MRTARLFVLMTLLPILLVGQEYIPLEATFIKEGRVLKNALSGGIQTGQFSHIDINQDGKQDIFVFDRMGSVSSIYLNEGGPNEMDYRFSQKYSDLFPSELQSWTLLRDFNGDGLADIFTSYIGGIHLYKARIGSDGEYAFDLVAFKNSPGGLDQIPLIAGSNFVQLPVPLTDVPAIVDVDGDGDIDVLSFDNSDGNYLEYFKNMQVERNLPRDTMTFVVGDPCFGKFYESGVSDNVKLSDDCTTCAKGGRIKDNKNGAHAGSTVAAFDGDGDGDLEIIVGDLTNKHVVYLTNGGTREEACAVAQDTIYPSNDVIAEMPVFLSAFDLDVNNDGRRDLIITPNQTGSGQNTNHIWLYLNEGTDSSPIFHFHQKDFLIEDVLSVGGGSAPTLVDYNGDGLKDLVIGNFGNIEGSNRQAHVELWLNTGSTSNLEFTLTDDDLFGLAAAQTDLFNLAPCFGDLDGDDDLDCIVGEVNGQLIYYENRGSRTDPSYGAAQFPYSNIFVGLNARPTIYDVNQDGKNDIIIGEVRANKEGSSQGALNYFQNFGEPFFTENATTKTLYLYSTDPTSVNFNDSAPSIAYGEGDKPILLVGAENGSVAALNGLTTEINEEVDTISLALGMLDVGRRSTPTAADVNGDGLLELFMGNARGGIQAWKTNLVAGSGVSTVEINDAYAVTAYPNPTPGLVHFTGLKDDLNYHLVDINGRLLEVGRISANRPQLDLSDKRSGIYFIQLPDYQQAHFTVVKF